MVRSIVGPIFELIQKSRTIRLFILGYFFCLATGWLLLQLPICQNKLITSLDTLFTAVSAISTTGLQTIDTGTSFSLRGQLVLLLLIQLGGVGYMVFSSMIILSLKKTMSVFQDLPHHFPFRELIKQVAWYTMVCELGGMIILYWFFKDLGVEHAAWNAVFHSISAFCTAGFSLFPTNLEGYANHVGINFVVSLLSILGAVGFFLCSDLLRKPLVGKRGVQFFVRIFSSFTTPMIVLGSLLLIFVIPNLLISVFQVISALTTVGFNTIDMRMLPHSALLLLIVLMLVGATITGSGMNMRKNAVPMLFKLLMNILTLKKTLRQRSQKVFAKRLHIATFTFMNYILVVSIPFWILVLIERHSPLPLFFEAVSALCTVGLSTGITPELSSLGKGLIILLMVTGRTGILLFAFAISTRKIPRKSEEHQELV